MNTAVVSLGSNIDPERNVKEALAIIASEQELLASSHLIRTKPLGTIDQSDFLNGAALVGTSLSHDNFTKYLKAIEQRLGRVRTSDKNGPRSIDLDILIWNGDVVSKDFFERDFVRASVAEIYPVAVAGTHSPSDRTDMPIKMGTVFNPREQISYGTGSVAKRVLLDKGSCSITLLAFDKGQGLAGCASPGDTVVYVLDGSALITVGGAPHRAAKGRMILVPANISCEVNAVEQCKMLRMVFGAV